MSKIIRLEAENFKRLKAVDITPDGNLVVIAGRNGQGKSSVLDAITAALGGTSSKTTPRPIRDGEGKAQIVLETEDLIVTRKFTAAGSTLTVKSKDGATYSKGQAKLDDLIGRLSLDPLAFTQLSDKEQLATLLDLVELPFDPAALDAERKTAFDARTDWNRTVKELSAKAGDYISRPADLPEDEVSVSELIGQYREAEALERDHQKDRESLAAHERNVATAEGDIADIQAEFARMQAEIDRLREYQDMQLVAADAMRTTIAAHSPIPELDAIQERIDGAEETNRAVRHQKEGQQVKARLKDAQTEADTLTEKLAEIDRRKADGLAAAQFPVDGLGLDESGVTYQGIPFKQASSAEQLRVSLAMAIALNPALRVIRIADGSLLDSDNLALVQKMAEENDFQVWIEMVHESGDYGVVIEDGAVL